MKKPKRKPHQSMTIKFRQRSEQPEPTPRTSWWIDAQAREGFTKLAEQQVRPEDRGMYSRPID